MALKEHYKLVVMKQMVLESLGKKLELLGLEPEEFVQLLLE